MKPHEIGRKLRKIRELKNFTQKHIAQQLNISSVAYGKIERGETDISLSRLQQIADIFELTMPQLLSFDENHLFFPNDNTQQAQYGNSKEVANLLSRVAHLLDKISQRIS